MSFLVHYKIAHVLAEFAEAVRAQGEAVGNSLQELLGGKKEIEHVCLEQALKERVLCDTFFGSWCGFWSLTSS